MKSIFHRLLLATALASTIPIAGCGPIAAPAAISGTVVGEITPKLKQAYVVAVSGAMALERAAELSVDLKLVTPGSPTAIQIADHLDNLHKLLQRADQALKVGDAITLTQNVGQIKELTKTIKVFLPKGL